MSILIISTCQKEQPLLHTEFVQPIADILKSLDMDVEVVHYLDTYVPQKHDRIIISGTALKDDAYLDHLDTFSWLATYEKPVLGICAGMQIIASVFGGNVQNAKEIGMTRCEPIDHDPLFAGLSEAYSLHHMSVSVPDMFDVLVRSVSCTQAIRKNHIVGVLFHPEVNNKEIIQRFVEK